MIDQSTMNLRLESFQHSSLSGSLVSKSESGDEALELYFLQVLCENVSRIVRAVDPINRYLLRLNQFSKVMVAYVNMFRTLFLNFV